MVQICKTGVIKPRQSDTDTGLKSNYTKQKLQEAIETFNRAVNESPTNHKSEPSTAPELMRKNTVHPDETETLNDLLQQSINAHRHIEDIAGKQMTETETLIPKISRDIVDKILVNDTSIDQKNEVRIILNSAILPATEVRITNNHGKIQVDLLTSSSEAYKVLHDQKALLQESLNLSLDKNVAVNLAYCDTNPEQNQGRSRNRREMDPYFEKELL